MVKLQAHRGYSTDFPENTLLSFNQALETGIHGIECDIRKTADGNFVIIHDPTIDRTVEGGLTGRIDELSISELKNMIFSYPSKFGTKFEGREDCRILTIDEFLDAFKDKKIDVILQFKMWVKDDILSIVDKVVSRGMLDRCYFFGANAYINWVKEYNENALTHNDGMANLSNYQDTLNNAVEHGHTAVSINANANETDIIQMINDIHHAGLLAHTSSVHSDFTNKTTQLIQLGADLILGDNPEEMLKALPDNSVEPSEIRSVIEIAIKHKEKWEAPISILSKNGSQWVKVTDLKAWG